MRAEEPEHDGKISAEAQPERVEEMRLAMPDTDSASFGRRLREAREAAGLSRNDVATRLRLPLRLVAQLEDDDYAGMDQGVYLRGYLSSYARLVGVPVVSAESVAAQNVRAAPLVATGQVSRSRYLFDRYSVSATYVILTALIVVPAVWLATHGGLEQNLARTTSLDSPSAIQIPPPAQVPTQDAGTNDAASSNETADAGNAGDNSTSIAQVESPKPQEPVVASMTPFTTPSAPIAAPVVETPAPAHATTGAHSLKLTLSAASWVEILGSDGSKIEYGILPAGAERTYSSDGPLSVRLGNADGAKVDVDGKPLDLAPFRRSNVARLRLFDANGGDAARAEF